MIIRLFFIFIQIGLLTFGGGMAMLPVMRQALVSGGLLTVQETVDMVAVSQMTPGPFAVNAATFAGMKIGGIPGAASATLGVITPSLIIVSLTAKYFFKFKSSAILDSALCGIRPVISALIAAAALNIGLESINGVLPAVIALAAFALTAKKVNPAWVITCAGILGAFVFRP